jgi:hypothetical protein
MNVPRTLQQLTPQREPAVLVQLIQTSLVALVGVLVAFGVWSPTDAQLGALVGLYVAVASVATYWLRGQVYTQATMSYLATLPPPPPPDTPDGPYPG